jgi:hypothetical protein
MAVMTAPIGLVLLEIQAERFSFLCSRWWLLIAKPQVKCGSSLLVLMWDAHSVPEIYKSN